MLIFPQMSSQVFSMIMCTSISSATDEHDLPETIKKQTDVAASWRNIGIQLGIRDSQLEVIQLQGESPLSCLRQMLSTWLRKNYNVKKFEEPTWMKLIEAVSHPAGGGNLSLAMKCVRVKGGRKKDFIKLH